MKYRDKKPALSLNDLSTAWLRRRVTDLKAMPGLNNTLGSIQMEADVLACKHPVFPPYSGGGELTGYTFLGQRHLAQETDCVKIRWKAYEVERECSAGDWFFSSRTALHPTEPLAVVSLTITNTASVQKTLDVGFLLSGRSRNTGSKGYAWAVPEVPTAVSSFSVVDGLYQHVDTADVPGTLLLSNDKNNGFSAQSFSPAPDFWEREQIARFKRELKPGEKFVLNFSASFCADREKALRLADEWHGDGREVQLLAKARLWWEELWEAAFTVGNTHFSGNAPVLESSRPELLKLYYMAVLTEITCRRIYPEAALKPSYLTLWPRRGEGSTYLTWEMPYISGLLSKLDPEGLEGLWKLTAQAPFLDSQVANLLEGSFGGWTCCGHPQTILTGALNLQRWAGSVDWKKSVIVRQSKQIEGFEAASQNQVLGESAEHSTKKMTGWEVFCESLFYHRDLKLPQSTLADVGNRDAYLECVTDYAHGTAALTAIQIRALKDSAVLTGESYDEEIGQLLQDVLALYQPGRGYFSCRFPDGRMFDAPNLYDVGVVLSNIGDELPTSMITEIAEFVRDNLITKTWCHSLWPLSLDVVSGLRCDHQWAGCFAAWPAQFVLGLGKSGYNAPWVEEWLQGMSQITAQGPFGQAYWAEDIYTPEAGGAAKCFDELSQGNHWVIQSGVHFFDMVVEGLLGVQADLDGNVSLAGGLTAYQDESSLYNIRTHGNLVHVVQGKVETEEG